MHHRPTSLAFALALLAGGVHLTGCSSTASRTRGSPAATLPVTRVVLYQNGVGYFERRGQLDGDTLVLQVRPDQINDLLKSLTVVDQGDGRAVSVSLPLEKSGAQQLSELPEQVRNAGGLLAVLHVFRGARVTVRGGEGTVSGRIVGVESVGSPSRGDDEARGGWRLTLKTADGELVIYPVEAIERVQLEDATLDVGLEKSLDISLDEGQWKPVSLSVRVAGKAPHELVVSYILAMPLWKPAYRVVLGEDQPLVQGWAVIDNVSGEDWLGTQLSLVAGTPMSFIYDLHSPQFAERVDLTPRMRERALAPVIERPGNVAAAPQAPPAPAMSAPAPSRAGAAPRGKSSKKRAARSDDYYAKEESMEAEDLDEPSLDYDQLQSEVRVAVDGARVGSLFRYDLRDPVDVPDRSSTLVSIVNARMPGKEVVLFRPEQESAAPYRAVMFTNDSGFTLEKGPAALYAGGTFVGEGFLDRMEKATTGFITYAVDGNVSLQRSDKSANEEFKLLKISGGVIETQSMSVHRTVYVVKNRNEEPITAVVKTSQRSGAKLRDPPKDMIETPSALFLPIEVGAGQEGELTVEWATPVRQQVAIDTDLATQVLKLYLGSGKAPPATARALDEVLKIKARVGAIADEERELRVQQRRLEQDQQRVRSNIDVLRRAGGNKPLLESLIGKLAEIETELGKLSTHIVRLSEERATLAARMHALIGQVTLEPQ